MRDGRVSAPRSTISGRPWIATGAVCWILTIEYFVAQFIAQLTWPSYSMARFDISALGAVRCGDFVDPTTGLSLGSVCSPLHTVMNLGFMALGTLTIAGVILTWTAWPRLRSVRAGLVWLAVGGVGSILSGVAPGDVNVPVHAIGGLLHWVGSAIGLICLAFGLRRGNAALALFSMACGLICLVGFFFYSSHEYLGLGRGWMQRGMTYPLTVWLIVCGAATLRAWKVES